MIITSQMGLSADEITAAVTITKRLAMLSETDWTQANDSPLDQDKKRDYAVYRQQLRDLSANPKWPMLEVADWPKRPD